MTDETRYLNALIIRDENDNPIGQRPLYDTNGNCRQQITVIATLQDGTMLILEDLNPAEDGKQHWHFPTQTVIRHKGVPYDNKQQARTCLQDATGLKARLLIEKCVTVDEGKVWSLWMAVVPDIRSQCEQYAEQVGMKYRFVDTAQWVELWNSGCFDRQGHVFRNSMVFSIAEFIHDPDMYVVPNLRQRIRKEK